MLGAESSCQEIPWKKHGTKGPEKHAICSPVRKNGVSGLRIISRRRRHLARSRSLRSATILKSSAGTGRNPIRSMYSVVYVERNKEPMESCHRTSSLKVHRCIGTHSWRMSRMKTKPPCRATAMGTRVALKIYPPSPPGKGGIFFEKNDQHFLQNYTPIPPTK